MDGSPLSVASSGFASHSNSPLLGASASPLLGSSSPRLSWGSLPVAPAPPRSARKALVLLGAGALTLGLALLAWELPNGPDFLLARKSERESFVSPMRRSLVGTERSERETPGVAELLLPAAPAASMYDALDPGLRYLVTDSWSGLSGHVANAFSLLYLALQTQRIAILPSWQDQGHYGDSIIRMSSLFDLDGLREAAGLLFVEMDDVKPNDPLHVNTTADEIGCYRASPWFDNALAFPNHNIHASILSVPNPSPDPWSFEAFTLFDFSTPGRLELAAEQAEAGGIDLPRNMHEEAFGPQGGGLLCYTNLWDLGHTGGGVRKVDQNGHYGDSHFEKAEKSRMAELLTGETAGVHPEWWHVGRFVDFTPAIWDIALSSVYETLEVDVLPPLVTVHLRRGDFLSWCPQQENCTPPITEYLSAVTPFLSLFNSTLPASSSSSPSPRVLVTTDETTDLKFLSSIDALGWARVNHTKLGTEEKLKAEYGEAWRWADSAVDQAILSLGQHFVGTRGSQVSQLSQLRVETWNGGQSAVVDRPTSWS